MKKHLTIIFLFLNLITWGQEFAPIGAKWYYEHASGLSPYLTIIESIKDSTVLNKSCKVLITKLISEKQTSYYTSVWDTTLVSKDLVFKSNDTVYHFNASKNKFDTLYVFNASEEDTILVNKCKINENCIDKFEYLIDSVSIINIAGTELRTQFIKPTTSVTWLFNDDWSYKDFPIIENIGSTRYFWGSNDLGIIEGPVQNIRCYKDNSITYKPLNITVDCDYLKPINPPSIITEIRTTESIVYPNPFKTELNINLTQFEEYEIYDSSNKLILSGKSKKIKTESLIDGVYFLKIKMSDTNFKTIKIIK